ncbi:hypothetical protein [Hungatella hathewayi]|uniref:hypothetical protein n=1 Tax=Hungatella hathewayi TaxID=154046 RepID=UPI00033AD904|nr:hypothetical protein [Hungatella hathewayi]CCZ61225.1 transcription regulator [Hungatella hathewayi CAG:224]
MVNLGYGRVMVAANRGFLPIEGQTDLLQAGSTIHRITLIHNESQLTRNYSASWNKEKTNEYLQNFAELLKEVFAET